MTAREIFLMLKERESFLLKELEKLPLIQLELRQIKTAIKILVEENRPKPVITKKRKPYTKRVTIKPQIINNTKPDQPDKESEIRKAYLNYKRYRGSKKGKGLKRIWLDLLDKNI